MPGTTFAEGQRVYHRQRKQFGTFIQPDCGTVGGVFSPAESVNARACTNCRGEVQRMPGFLRDRLIGATA